MYKCSRCGKEFGRKDTLDYHVTHDACRINTHFCRLCGKGFTTATSMYRHINHSCKVKKQEDANKEDILERLVALENSNKDLAISNKKLVEENKNIKNQIKKVVASSKTIQYTTNNTTVNNTQHNTQNINRGIVNNVILVGYGKEDISKLSKGEVLKVLQNGYQSTVKLTEAVHFNPKYPENHNIYISNMKDKYAMMFDGERWTLTIKEDLINQIYEDKKSYIEENLEEFVDSLSATKRQALKRWLDSDDENPKIKTIKENIKLLLYNSRHLIQEDTAENHKPAITLKTKSASRSKKILKDNVKDCASDD